MKRFTTYLLIAALSMAITMQFAVLQAGDAAASAAGADNSGNGFNPPPKPPIEIEADPMADANLMPEKKKMKELEKLAPWAVSFWNATAIIPKPVSGDVFKDAYTLNFTAVKKDGGDMYGSYTGAGRLKNAWDTTHEITYNQGRIYSYDVVEDGPLSGIDFELSVHGDEGVSGAEPSLVWTRNHIIHIHNHNAVVFRENQLPAADMKYSITASQNGGAVLNLYGTAHDVVTFHGRPSKKISLEQAKREIAVNVLPLPPLPEPAPLTGYAAAADLVFEIAEAMQKVIIDKTPGIARSPNGFFDPVSGTHKVFQNFFLIHTRELSEDQAGMDAVLYRFKEQFGIKDARIFRDAPHNYRLTGAWPQSDNAFEVFYRYDSATGAMQAMCVQNGDMRDSFEFLPLGNDRYALQNYIGMVGSPGFGDYEKAIITYRDGKAAGFHYTSVFRLHAYRCIYPDSPGLDESWFDEDEPDFISAEIIYDGSKLSY